MVSVIFLQFLYIFSVVFSLAYSYNFSSFYNEDFKQLINIEELGAKIFKALENEENAFMTTVMMIDASSKFINGLGGGNFFDLGHFDECYKIKSGDIFGKYCLGTLPLVQQQQKFKHLFKRNLTETIKPIMIHQQPRLLGVGQYTGMHFAVCVPSSLKAEEIPGFFKYTEDMCYSKKKEPDLLPGAITTIVMFSILGLIMTASTIFDVYLHYTNSESPHELLIAFSVWTNGRKIFTPTKNSDQLLCLNGIRALSMMWVILGLVQQQQKFKHFFKRNFTKTVKPTIIHKQPILLGVGQYTDMHFAVCVPSSFMAEEIPGFFKFTEDLCYSKKKEPDLSPGAITTM